MSVTAALEFFFRYGMIGLAIGAQNNGEERR
jgi:hypothetical protein